MGKNPLRFEPGDGKNVTGSDLDDALRRLKRKISRIIFLRDLAFRRVRKSPGLRPKRNLDPIADRQNF